MAQSTSSHSYEVLLILNGPKDPYFEEIKTFKLKHQFFALQLFYIPEANVSTARNLGLNKSRGSYILFVDDDDILSENYLQAMNFEISDDSVVFTNVMSLDNLQLKSGINPYFIEFKRKIGVSNLSLIDFKVHSATVWAKIFPKKMLLGMHFEPKYKNGQDSIFMALLSKRIRRIVITDPGAIYYYRKRPNSASRKNKGIYYELSTTFKLFKGYIGIYLSDPLEYDFLFFLHREAALVKRLLAKLKLISPQNSRL